MAVHVILINAASNTQLGEADFPAEQLPESFHAPTTLHLAGGDWHVERAEPMTRAAYVASGTLTIWMTKVERVEPKTILYSLPTFESVQPPFSGSSTGDAMWLHEDDWRQVELVSTRFAEPIAAELAAIREVIANHRTGAGYARLHVRERVPHPLAGVRLTVPELGLTGRRGVALGPSPGPGALVENGFAFELDGGLVYGREEHGAVVALGFQGTALMPALAHAHDLVLVHWVLAEQLRSDGTRFVGMTD